MLPYHMDFLNSLRYPLLFMFFPHTQSQILPVFRIPQQLSYKLSFCHNFQAFVSHQFKYRSYLLKSLQIETRTDFVQEIKKRDFAGDIATRGSVQLD